uniref:UBP-type domain-containing protein n=1 Tax=Gouania willdenowi TaxID=441366 RepID=A0A8C5EK92_GOUWI
MAELDTCPHLDSIGEVTKEDLLHKSKGTCQSCGAGGPNLWACLQIDCSYVGCGESFSDHSTLHRVFSASLSTTKQRLFSVHNRVFILFR